MAKQKIPVNAILSARIKETRMWIKNGSKMTQAELAERIGVEDQTIRKYESGKFGIPKSAVTAIALEFGCCPEYLYGETNCFTLEEYQQVRQEIKDAITCAVEVQNESKRKWDITEKFFEVFFGYRIRNTYIKELDNSFTPVITMEDQQGTKVSFASRHEAESFLLSYYEDAAKLLRYHLLDYEAAKTDTKPTPTP